MRLSMGKNNRTERRAGPVAKVAVAMLLGFFVAACAGGDMKSDRDVARERVEAYLAANPSTDKRTADFMRRFQLRKGMTQPQVIAVWGTPRNKMKWRGGEGTQLFFECSYWPNTCGKSGRRGRGADDDSMFPQAFFTEGKLTDWKAP